VLRSGQGQEQSPGREACGFLDPTVAVVARLPRSMLKGLDWPLAAERRRTDPDIARQDLLRETVR
jgi:hypothetical protein